MSDSPSPGDFGESGWADKRLPIASGVIGVTIAANNTPASATVPFPLGRFDVAPQVVATANTTDPDSAAVSVSGASTTGCTIWATVPSGAPLSLGVHWVAVESG